MEHDIQVESAPRDPGPVRELADHASEFVARCCWGGHGATSLEPASAAADGADHPHVLTLNGSR